MSAWGTIKCALGFHSCATQSDDQGVWGECVRCHRRFGFVSRYALRQYADAEHRKRMAEDAGYRALFTPTHRKGE